MYRPQFPMPKAPKGFIWQPCLYEFDQTNTPALAGLSLMQNQETSYIPLPLDHDAPFILLACKIQNGGVNVLLWSPWGDQLMDAYIIPAEFASSLPPFTILEGPGIECPPGSVLQMRLQGQ